MFRHLSTAIIAFAFCHRALADTDREPLTEKIVKLDTRLFNAFSRRDLNVMKTMLSQEREFYHDKAGLTDYQQNLKATANMFNSDTDLQRELLPEFTEVHSVPGYGVSQTGRHRFCHTAENGEPDSGVVKFLHIWKQQDSNWQITRVVSYDH